MSTIMLTLRSGLYLDYLKHLFPPDEKGLLHVSGASDLGKIMIAMAKVSPSPRKNPSRKCRVGNADTETVCLQLPDSDITWGLKGKFLYYTAGDMVRIAAALKATFNIDLTSYYLKGQRLGMCKQDILEAFIVSRGLVSTEPFDSLHKRVFRNEQRAIAETRNTLYRKVRYFDESLDASGLV